MAIIQMYRGHYVQLAVDRRAVLITAVATKRNCQPLFFTTKSRDEVDLAGGQSVNPIDREDARSAVLEALESAQAQVIFDELQRVSDAERTKARARFETRSNA